MAVKSNENKSELGQKSRPNIFVISAPSATGKTTLVNMLIRDRGDKLIRGITATHRPKRDGEIHGEHYYFYTEQDFEQKIADGFFIEWANVHGRRYGLPNHEVDRLLSTGKSPLLVLDIQGLKNLRQKLDPEKYSKIIDIFILPPSEDEVVRRMGARGDICPVDIANRLETMRSEMAVAPEFSYRVVNDDLERAYGELLEIVDMFV
jgi:guanylate kinase